MTLRVRGRYGQDFLVRDVSPSVERGLPTRDGLSNRRGGLLLSFLPFPPSPDLAS